MPICCSMRRWRGSASRGWRTSWSRARCRKTRWCRCFPVHVVTVPGRHRTPRVKAFTDFMVAQMTGAQ
jgi:hypothetical protein